MAAFLGLGSLALSAGSLETLVVVVSRQHGGCCRHFSATSRVGSSSLQPWTTPRWSQARS